VLSAQGLYGLTGKGIFDWSKEAQNSFDELKGKFRNKPMVASFNRRKQMTIYVDASGSAIGVVVLQEGKIVNYLSKKFSETQKRYGAT
jgi:hypothetical protein